MIHSEYIQDAIRTESADFEKIRERLDDKMIRVLHAAIGIGTEAGELQDAVKKAIFYGKPLDITNVEEELGDLLWYFAVLCDALGLDPAVIMGRNIAKLRARFPDKFSDEQALNRNLPIERLILEGK